MLLSVVPHVLLADITDVHSHRATSAATDAMLAACTTSRSRSHSGSDVGGGRYIHGSSTEGHSGSVPLRCGVRGCDCVLSEGEGAHPNGGAGMGRISGMCDGCGHGAMYHYRPAPPAPTPTVADETHKVEGHSTYCDAHNDGFDASCGSVGDDVLLSVPPAVAAVVQRAAQLEHRAALKAAKGFACRTAAATKNNTVSGGKENRPLFGTPSAAAAADAEIAGAAMALYREAFGLSVAALEMLEGALKTHCSQPNRRGSGCIGEGDYHPGPDTAPSAAVAVFLRRRMAAVVAQCDAIKDALLAGTGTGTSGGTAGITAGCSGSGASSTAAVWKAPTVVATSRPFFSTSIASIANHSHHHHHGTNDNSDDGAEKSNTKGGTGSNQQTPGLPLRLSQTHMSPIQPQNPNTSSATTIYGRGGGGGGAVRGFSLGGRAYESNVLHIHHPNPNPAPPPPAAPSFTSASLSSLSHSSAPFKPLPVGSSSVGVMEKEAAKKGNVGIVSGNDDHEGGSHASEDEYADHHEDASDVSLLDDRDAGGSAGEGESAQELPPRQVVRRRAIPPATTLSAAASHRPQHGHTIDGSALQQKKRPPTPPAAIPITATTSTRETEKGRQKTQKSVVPLDYLDRIKQTLMERQQGRRVAGAAKSSVAGGSTGGGASGGGSRLQASSLRSTTPSHREAAAAPRRASSNNTRRSTPTHDKPNHHDKAPLEKSRDPSHLSSENTHSHNHPTANHAHAKVARQPNGGEELFITTSTVMNAAPAAAAAAHTTTATTTSPSGPTVARENIYRHLLTQTQPQIHHPEHHPDYYDHNDEHNDQPRRHGSRTHSSSSQLHNNNRTTSRSNSTSNRSNGRATPPQLRGSGGGGGCGGPARVTMANWAQQWKTEA